MRFVAGRGAVAELLAGAPWRSYWPGAMRQSAIGKMLLAWALRRRGWPAGARGEEAGRERRSGKEAASRGRCGRAADRPVCSGKDAASRGRSGKEAGRGTAMAKRHAGNAAVAKMLLAGAPWQSRRRRRGMAVARERHSRLARERRGRLAGNAAADWQGNATTDWQGNARNAKEPAPTDGTGPSQTFGCIQAEQSLVEDFACLFLLGMRIYI